MKTILPVTFLVCVSFQLSTNCLAQSRVDVGKSYANISKLNTGGTFQPGDIVEVRVTVAVLTQGVATIIDNVKFSDIIPSKVTHITNSMRIATNEGLTYKGPFTEAIDGDQGQLTGSTLTIGLGKGATSITGGRIKSDSSRPSFYGNTCIMMACYRVQINTSTAYGDTIVFPGGSITYRSVQPAGGTSTINFPTSRIYVYQNNAACSNGKDVSAASDSLGTFASGIITNRPSPLNFSTTYIKQNLGANSPQDYNYAIVNNSSPTGLTNPNVSIPNAGRVFTFWDIGGDHTGAANPTKGNMPAAPGTIGGYMVLINSSYKTDTAYRETLSNLCPDTYYEFSAWIRNICARCSCDSTGKGSGSVGFLPAPGNDSSGVKPNISFVINGLTYYSSGDIRHNRNSPWVKYGFTFKTKPGQTSASFLIQNNSPGGGGNDWALDDITVSHCGPSLVMNYNPYVLGCRESPFLVQLSDTIRYTFSDSYIYYKWQRSNVGGTIWSDLTGPGTSGIGAATLVNGQYQYVASLPPFLASAADSGRYYRVLVATSWANLASTSCSYSDGSKTMIKVVKCGSILKGDFIQFRGSLTTTGTHLMWNTKNEQNISSYTIQKSFDGVNFTDAGTIEAHNFPVCNYVFNDNGEIRQKNFYRLKMNDNNQLFKYSKVIVILKEADFSIKPQNTYFDTEAKAELIASKGVTVHVTVINELGIVINKYKQQVTAGLNFLSSGNLNAYSSGFYLMHVSFENEVHRLKFIKTPAR